jgi:hypothetical protein
MTGWWEGGKRAAALASLATHIEGAPIVDRLR